MKSHLNETLTNFGNACEDLKEGVNTADGDC